MERKRPGKEHSLSEDRRGQDNSGQGKKATERGALTSWGPQREGRIRTRKESDQASGTYFLETAEGRPGQDAGKK